MSAFLAARSDNHMSVSPLLATMLLHLKEGQAPSFTNLPKILARLVSANYLHGIGQDDTSEFYSSDGKPMSTPAQIAANQKNSQLSTGPNTEEGKAASSKDDLRHGFTGAFAILPWEKQEEFNTLLDELRAEHQPATITETLLIEKMAQSYWLSQRAIKLQQISCFHDETDSPEREKKLALYLRYQTTHDRNFHKCLNDLLKLRAEKRKIEIGFESQEMKQSRARQQAEREQSRARQQADAEKRKQELHKWKVLRAEADVDHRILQNLSLNLQNPEYRLSVGAERIIAAEKAA